ncbi:MAG: (d)CMP kinase [Nitrososphaeraceae archaeon]|nr:(d)CMP kinase [Nitrososphaeraceae archaeon]
MNRYISIAIDGPAASGKSSVGLKVANRLGYLYLDTGVMYRAVTWAALDKGIDIFDESKVSKLALILKIRIDQPSKDDGRVNDIYVDDIDVTWKVKEQRVNENVSQVSKYPGVRNSLTLQQQNIALKGNIVMVGRDIGTVVLANAKRKFFLNASEEERARRRYEEEKVRGGNPNYKEILDNVKKRDKIDSTRDLAPLVPANDAVIINTNNKNIDQVVEEILLKI